MIGFKKTLCYEMKCGGKGFDGSYSKNVQKYFK